MIALLPATGQNVPRDPAVQPLQFIVEGNEAQGYLSAAGSHRK